MGLLMMAYDQKFGQKRQQDDQFVEEFGDIFN